MKSIHTLDTAGRTKMEIDWNDITPGTHQVKITQAAIGDPNYPRRSDKPAIEMSFRTTSEALRELVQTLDRLA